MNSELDKGIIQYSAESEEDEDDDKGVVSGIARSLAGCVGGAVGYDQIMDILEKRVSYWTLVKFLGKKSSSRSCNQLYCRCGGRSR